MGKLIQYIIDHTTRGECQCGLCMDKNPDTVAPSHSVDVHFFWVSTRLHPETDQFTQLIESEYPDLERLSGGPSYIELGGVMGDQDAALRFIGLGELLGMWHVITPKTIIPGLDDESANSMAGQGMVMCSGYKVTA